MFAQWVTDGIGAGVRIWFAGFTVIIMTGAVLGVTSIIAALTTRRDEHED